MNNPILLLLLGALPISPTLAASTPNQCPQVPTLYCHNGSTCISGLATYDPKHISALDTLQTHESGYHCDCLPGYIGHECEIEIDECGNNNGEQYDPTMVTVPHTCYHGSECKSSGDSVYCDCNSLNSKSDPTAAKFAGLMCEHEATSLCAVSMVETMAPNRQFCTNHGECIKMVTKGDPHPGCDCREGWSGDHCELRSDVFAAIPKLAEGDEGGGNKTAGKVLFSMLIIAIICVVATIAVIVIRAKRKQSGPREKAVGKTAVELGVGELEADGSGTMVMGAVGGSPGEGTEEKTDEEGDVEVKENVFKIDGDDDEKEDSSGEDDETSEKVFV